MQHSTTNEKLFKRAGVLRTLERSRGVWSPHWAHIKTTVLAETQGSLVQIQPSLSLLIIFLLNAVLHKYEINNQ